MSPVPGALPGLVQAMDLPWIKIAIQAYLPAVSDMPGLDHLRRVASITSRD
jgi:hypothetical protein